MSDLFPQHEYRGHEANDLSVRAAIKTAKAITIDTQFDGPTADTLAAGILAATKNYAQIYSFTVDGILTPDDCATAMPRIHLVYGSIDITSKITSLKVDYAKKQTTITVRGAA